MKQRRQQTKAKKKKNRERSWVSNGKKRGEELTLLE